MTRLAEPEWDQASRDLATALDAVAECPHCHGDPALCQDPARADDWVADDPIRCYATTARSQRQKAFEKSHTEDTNPALDALSYPVRLIMRAATEPPAAPESQ